MENITNRDGGVLENQSKNILLLSNDPADASFLSEIAVMQQADLSLVANEGELCSKIAEFRGDQSLAAIFVDVSNPTLLRKFEYEFQSKLGNALACELSGMVHFISGTPMLLNREVKQSPYFSFYSERRTFGFNVSAAMYQNSFYFITEHLSKHTLAFDQGTRVQYFEKVKNALLSSSVSAEWMLKFKHCLDDMIEKLFVSRFDFSIHNSGDLFKIIFTSTSKFDSELFEVEKFLNFGVSSMISDKSVVLFVPVFREMNDSISAFKFFKVEK
jgi:hypothetical protein